MLRYLVFLFCLLCLGSAGKGKGGGSGGGQRGSGDRGSGDARANCVMGYNCTVPGTWATFNYTIRNVLVEPQFDNTVTLSLGKHAPLIKHMERAVQLNSVDFESFTVSYYPSTGYVVEAVNGVSGVWQLSSVDGVVDLGVSSFVPQQDDDVVLELIEGV